MATDFFDISNGLKFIWHAYAGFGLVTEEENVKFTPEKDTPYARLTIVPTGVTIATMSSIGEDQHNGIMAIDLFYPQGEGSGNALRKADEIRSVFKANLFGDVGGAKLHILSTSRSGGRIENGWYTIRITVEWRARTFRA